MGQACLNKVLSTFFYLPIDGMMLPNYVHAQSGKINANVFVLQWPC